MHPFLAYLLATLLVNVRPAVQWRRFVVWAFWGENAQQSYY